MKSYQHLWSMTAILSSLLVCNMVVRLANAQQEPQVAEVVEAREFRLVGEGDRTLAVMSKQADGHPNLTFFGKRGEKRLEVRSQNDGQPLVQLNDAGGNARLKLVCYEAKGDADIPYVQIFDAQGKVRGAFALNLNNNPMLELYGKQTPGQQTQTLALRPDSVTVAGQQLNQPRARRRKR